MKRIGVILALFLCLPSAVAWGNGGSIYNQPEFADEAYEWSKTSMYGTHDYLAEYALKFLPSEEKEWLITKSYSYGTELPDSSGLTESLNDRNAQYMTYNSKGLSDDSLASRAMKKYDAVLVAIRSGSTATASKWAGAIVSYVSDAGLFSRVIGISENGLKFENLIQSTTRVFPSQDFENKYGEYIVYDGSLEMVSPYDAIAKVAQETYLGADGSCSAQWMEDNYDPDDKDFIECAGRNFNNIVNAEADVLHTFYMAGVRDANYELHAYDWANFKVSETPVERPPAEEQPTHDEPLLEQLPAEEQPAGETPDANAIPEPEKPSDSSAYYIILVAVLVVLIPFILLELKRMGKLPNNQKKDLSSKLSKVLELKKKAKKQR